MSIPFSFLVSWAKVHRSEDDSLTYVRTLEKKKSFLTVEEILSSRDSGKKISDLCACLSARIDDIQKDYQESIEPVPVITKVGPSPAVNPIVLGSKPESDDFASRLKAFIKDYLEIKLNSAPEITQAVFKESFVPQPFHTNVPSDESLASRFNVSGQTIRNRRNGCVDKCRVLLMEGKVLDSYSADSTLVQDLQAFKEQFGSGISYETASRITGISDERTFFLLLRLFDLDLTKRNDVKIQAVLPNRTISSYSANLGRVIDFFREETVCLRYYEDIVPALKKIIKDPGLLETFQSVILHSDEFVKYQVMGQDYIALRWDLLQNLASRVCWIVFQEGAFDLKSAISADRILKLYNSREYAGKFKEPKIERDQIRATQLNGCWRLMNIGKQEYWIIRRSKNDQFDLEKYVKEIITTGMSDCDFIQAAKDSGLIPIYSEGTLLPIFDKYKGSGGGGGRPTFDWDVFFDETEALLRSSGPLKSTDIASFLYQNHQLNSPQRAFSSNLLSHIKGSSRFITKGGASPKEGVWVALPGMAFPKSYRDEIREQAVALLQKEPSHKMKRSILYKTFGPMVPPDRVLTSALQSIFDDETYFFKSGEGRDTTITLNPLLIP